MKDEKNQSSSIDTYIQSHPKEVQIKLQRLRATIRRLAPKATEAIKYGIPTFVLEKNLVHFAAFKNHIGFYPGASGIKQFSKEFKGYKSSKGAVQFPIDGPLPLKLIEKIVRFRIKESKAELVKKAKAK